MPSNEKIRVMIVDDIAETRENIRRLLQFDLNIEVVAMARSGQEAVTLSSEVKPDVVVMDINMPDMDGISATELIHRKIPFIQVIILSVQSDPNYMRRAMLAGARDFLTKPPTIDDLTAAIHRAGSMAIEERGKTSSAFPVTGTPGSAVGGIGTSLGKIITVYSPKGGVGTTTIATNLALALHSPEMKTALVDGSLQFGDTAVFLNEQVKNSILELAPRVDELDVDVVESVIIKNAASGIHVLAAPPRPEMAEKVTGEQFGKVLQFMRRIYSNIVVDTTCYLTDVVLTAIDNADVIVLVTTQDIPAIKNTNSFLSLSDASGIKRDRILFVMNRFDKRIGISPERVGESLKQPIVASIPFDDKVIPNSVNRGVPFVLDNKTHPASKSIFSLAELVRQKASKEEAESDNTGRK